MIMDKKKLLYALAGLGGVAAWLVFILACTGWPARSPDGSKVLFILSSPDPKSKDSAVALYDRGTGSATTLYSYRTSTHDMTPMAQFSRDGRQAILVLNRSDDQPAEVLSLPLDGRKPVLHVALPGTKGVMLAPFPEIGGELYMGSDFIYRMNLATGDLKIKKLTEGEGILLMGDGDPVWYAVFEIERPGHEDKGMQFGRLNRDDLSLKPYFEFWDADQQKLGIEGFNGVTLTPEPGGAHLLVAAYVDHKPVLVLFGKIGVDRIIKPEFPTDCRIASLAWSADGKAIYAALLAPGANKAEQNLVIAETSPGGGQVRLDAVLTMAKTKDLVDTAESAMGLSLSPDGRTLAISTGLLPPDSLKSEQDRALFLIDLTDPARKVTRIAAPALPKVAVTRAAKE